MYPALHFHCSVRTVLVFVLVILLSFTSFHVHAQKEAYNWYFGTNAGLTFNTDPPTALTNGALVAREGCASISDANGNLLFYTNGKTVWNQNHLQMDNGFGLAGSDASTQSSIIVKLPGSTSIYYIFTVPDQIQTGTYCYSIVDMSMNAGLGKVTTVNEPLLKDFTNTSSTFSDHTEALTASLHTNKTDIWIVVHESSSPRFYSYLLTPAGLQTPVSSDAGTLTHHLSQCRISPDGKKLALGGYFTNAGSGVTELYDFNSTTGKISNAIQLRSGAVYGISFSADSHVLYTASSGASIFQFDLSQPTAAAIIGSALFIGSGSGNYYPSLQLGPDNKIYLAQSNKSYLGLIEKPDVIGTGCLFKDNAISLGGKISQLGLPTFMVNYVSPRKATVELGKDTILCPSEALVLDAGNPGASYLWNTNEQTQTISVKAAGKYYVDVTLDNNTESDTILVSYTQIAPIGISENYSFCADEDPDIVLNPSFTADSYIWQDGSSSLPYTITLSGIYWLERTIGNCAVKDTFTVFNSCAIIVPNLITPNNDGMNDLFFVKHLTIPDWNLTIHNGWGKLIYQAEGYLNNWNARGVSDGIYYYHLTNPSTSKEYKGWVHILQ